MGDEGSWAHTCGANSSLLGLSVGPKLQEGEGDRKREGGRKQMAVMVNEILVSFP